MDETKHEPTNELPELAQEPSTVDENGVFVVTEPDDAGGTTIKIERIGDVRAAEVPVLLELAAKMARENLGI